MSHKLIAFLDTETTGLNRQSDKIVELSIVIVDSFTLKERSRFYSKINPEIPIAKEVSDIHGLTNQILVTAPIFKYISKEIQGLLSDKIIAGHNVEFDIEFLHRQLVEAGEIGIPINNETIDTLLIEKLVNSHKLSETYKRYFNKEMTGAHSASTDVLGCIDIFKAQKLSYPEHFGNGFENCFSSAIKEKLGYKQLNYLDHAKCFYKHEEVVCFAFGKHKGKPAESEINYLNWMINNNFSEETKTICKNIISQLGT